MKRRRDGHIELVRGCSRPGRTTGEIRVQGGLAPPDPAHEAQVAAEHEARVAAHARRVEEYLAAQPQMRCRLTGRSHVQ